MKVRIASAGTGKTTSLVLRYLELIDAGVPLRRLAGITFTRTAAAEIRLRIGAALVELLDRGEYLGFELREQSRPRFREAVRELDGSTLSTIHGFVIDALRLSAPAMGLDPDFGTLPEWEAQSLFEEEVRSLLYLASNPQHPLHWAASLEVPVAAMTALFTRRSLVERFCPDDDAFTKALVALFEKAYSAYQQRLGARHLAPGEIERRSLKMMGVAAARMRLCQRYRVVLVDEFQDVNPMQGRFFEALEEAGISVEVVGDPKQSIYGFRNADVGVFRRALERGEQLPPLDRSYRHANLVNRFLNKLTQTLAASGLGFGPHESPSVESATADVRGHVEVHWVVDKRPLASLRELEATILAGRLAALHLERGIPYREMALLTRSHHSLEVARQALQRAGVPTVIQQGRGFFERIEIRDLYNALRAGVQPAGVSFAAWLRGPFGRLDPRQVEEVLSSPEPKATLARCAPGAAERYQALRELLLLSPLEALKRLIRGDATGGTSYLSSLDRRQRENVDALLLDVAQRPPHNIEMLLERLELQLKQVDAGDVPQTGEGVRLLTVHAAKGLEWRVTAVFDLGRGKGSRRESLRVDPLTGKVSLPGSSSFQQTGELLAQREEAESYRLLYVAASRPREVLLLSGSVGKGQPGDWVQALELMGVGPSDRTRKTHGFVLARHAWQEAAVIGAVPPEREEAPSVAEWSLRSFYAHPYPPVYGPSHLTALDGDEPSDPLTPGDGSGAAHRVGKASAIGTLVHYAISQGWSPARRDQIDNLRAQEVMFPFGAAEQDEILAEVGELLGNYRAMLGCELPAEQGREIDEAELPVALPAGATVWQGVIDRLYRVGSRWYLDDYKTDLTVAPERHLTQLAIYARAVKVARGFEPLARLVFLRTREVVAFEQDELDRACERALGGKSQAETRTANTNGGLRH